MACNAILEEFRNGCFYTNTFLAEAYTTFIRAWVGDEAESVDSVEEALNFLDHGYAAYMEECRSNGVAPDPLLMIGGGDQSKTASKTQREDSTSTAVSTVSSSDEPVASTSQDPNEKKRQNSESSSEDDEESDEPTLEVLETTERYLTRFRTTFREEVMHIKNFGKISFHFEEHLQNMFDTVLKRQKEALDVKDEDKCILEIRGSNSVDKPIWFSLRKSNQINGRVILDKVSQVLNSNESFIVDGNLTLSYVHIPLPEAGSGRPGSERLRNEFTSNWIQSKLTARKNYSLFDPGNTEDSMCLARCIVVGQVRGVLSYNAFKDFKKPHSAMQRKEALKLCESANIDPEKPCGIDEIKKMQQVLTKNRLVVFVDRKANEIVFHGPKSTEDEPRKNIYLFWFENHFYLIMSMPTLLGSNYYCHDCLKAYTTKGVHACGGSCWRCSSPKSHDKKDIPLKKCGDCCRYFAGDDCFDYHKTQKVYLNDRTTCQVKKFCPFCEKSYSLVGTKKGANFSHRCGQIVCEYCKLQVPENHMCYMQPWEPKEPPKNTRIIRLYFDFECTQSQSLEENSQSKLHVPNLIICHQVCQKCEDIVETEHKCVSCGEREHIFDTFEEDSEPVVSQFFDYLQELCAEKKTEIICFSHNGKSYDNYFIISEALKREIKVEPLLQGGKVLCLQMSNITFKDSLCFLPQKLSSLPKAFGLTELRKGEFPHLANCKEFYSYQGPILDKKYYITSHLSEKDLLKFNEWHAKLKRTNYVFNFQWEILTYCQSDVQILRQSMESFRSLFMKENNFDPLYYCITLSSACMASYRLNHMPLNKIAIVPQGGYRAKDLSSYEAHCWLMYEQSLLGNKAIIQTAENGREVRILSRPVDGYAEIPLENGSIQKTIYQYHGCRWHQCLKCYSDPVTRGKLRGGAAEDRYETTKRITALFEKNQYKVIEKWACDFKNDRKHNLQIASFFEQNTPKRVPPLRLRDALYGGRTSAVYTYKKADLSKGESIAFYDVCSEYPSVNLKGAYPYGHPQIYLENDPAMPSLKDWNGVASIKILPCQDLFLPVLPYRCHGKLNFPLCRTCLETRQDFECNHLEPEARALTGTWCAPEIQLAVSKGYKVLCVYEVYQYPGVVQYNPVTKEEGLFSSFIRKNMALKIECSGWPAHVETEEQKDDFVRQVFENDGIVIDKSRVKKNPGLRFIAKILNNGFWGKLAQRNNMSQTKFVYSYGELLQLIEDTKFEVNFIVPIGENCLQVNYSPREDFHEDSLMTNSVVHAAFTTTLGRMMLYNYLALVDQRTLYFDTDSICFLDVPGAEKPKLGPFLGDLTDQLADDYGPGSFCTEFCSAGPKNYGYKVAVGGDLNNIKTVIKVRGISINSSCSNVVTFENLKSMVLNDSGSKTVHIPSMIVRLPSWQIVTRNSSKKWSVCLDKRRRIDKERTVPYGFKAELLDSDDFHLLAALDNLANNPV